MLRRDGVRGATAALMLVAVVIAGCGQEPAPRAVAATPTVAPAPRGCLRDLNAEYSDRSSRRLAWPSGYRNAYALRYGGHCVVVLDPRACPPGGGDWGKVRDDRTYWLDLGWKGMLFGGNDVIDPDPRRAVRILRRWSRIAQRSPNARVVDEDGRIEAVTVGAPVTPRPAPRTTS